LNPASYTSISLTTFEVGVNSKNSWYQSTADTALINRTWLGNVAVGVPISKKWGMSFGLLPYSSIGYKLTYETLAPTGDSITYYYDGSGGINTLYFGNAYQIHKNISIGLNICYLFGIMTNTSTVLFTSGENFIGTEANKTVNVSDVLLNGGFQFKLPIKTNYTLIIGGTYSNKANIHAIKDVTTRRFSASTGTIVDTIIQDSSVSGNFIIPQRIGVGFSFAKNDHWLFGADVSWQQWSAYTSPFDQYDELTNTIQLAIGGEYMINKKTSTSYFNKVRYRAGFNYGNSFVVLDSDKINQYGITLGAGFPVIKSHSLLNIGVELGRTQSANANALNENYIKMSIGFTLNDKWFVKRKYD
jgi:long-subunit fatty acid transport protein